MNTWVETADPDRPAHRVAAGHRHQVVVCLAAALLAADGRPEPESAELARRIVLLTDGAIVTAPRESTAAPAAAARAIAAALPADSCAETVGRG
ncbi:hypothetical protein [Kitasatospora griseola]|uniref:hypothetical protein n=1 Tax=Kitasatospora griseola TaxID=2064 RepID=UPI001671396E|nr:hypothetical protein [Kitasatospora griseola]GGQ71610.1 hypothetical protein GCM10010195_29050 [Kitasatospora griseola]